MQTCSINNFYGRIVLFATILVSGMAILAGTTIAVALPTIQAYFDVGLTSIQWVISAYALVLAALILTAGSLGDHFGRRRIFSYGIVVFIVGSLLSGFATSISYLILFQVLQGIGAAMMIPGSLAIINSCFEEKSRGQAIGLWSGFSAGLATIGPFFGGWLVDVFGWQAVFFINVPLGILALFITLRYVQESKNPTPGPLDWWGTLFIVLGFSGISFGLIQGPQWGFANMWVDLTLIFGLIFLLLFVLTERYSKAPMMPLFLFKSPLVSCANAMTFFIYFALQGMIFFLIFHFQQIQDFSPTMAGLALLPPMIFIAFLSGPAGKLSDKIGPRLQMIGGPLLVALGMILFLVPGVETNYFIHFFPGLVLFGVGVALVIAPLTKSALAVEEKYSGTASGINNAVSRFAALMAVAILGAIMLALFSSALAKQINAADLKNETKIEILSQSNKLGGITLPESLSQEDRVFVTEKIKESFVSGFRFVMIINIILVLLSALLAFILIRNPRTVLHNR